MEAIRVKADSKVGRVARFLAEVLRENNGKAIVEVITPAALNQAVKAIIWAGDFFRRENKVVCFKPSFREIKDLPNSRTGLKLDCALREKPEK